MVAIPRQPESLVESLFQAGAVRRKAREDKMRAAGRPVRTGPGVLVRFALIVADVFGTLLMCAAVTVGAFLWLVPVGFVVLGLSIPLLEFKVSWSAKRRAMERAAER